MNVVTAVQYTVSRRGVPAPRSFQRWVAAACRGRRHRGEVVIRLVGERESARLNRRYRGHNRPTNVLSFPAPEEISDGLLGDLVICAPVVVREARRQRKPARAHWAHMVVHGVSHLLGYDHQDPAQAHEMEARECAVLRGLGFDNPYAGEGAAQ